MSRTAEFSSGRRSRMLAGTGLFAALALVLNLTVNVPAPYASFLSYEVWEIPIVVAFLVFGEWSGVGVAFINFLALQLLSPGQLATGPLYNLSAILLMLLGIALARRISSWTGAGMGRQVIAATSLGLLLRAVGMYAEMWLLMPYPPPIGFAVPVGALPALLSLITLFNLTVALYTVPAGYWLAGMIPAKYKVFGGARTPGAVAPRAMVHTAVR